MNLITLSQPQSAAAEAYRSLRTNIMFSGVDRSLRLLTLTAPTMAENSSQTLANLAVTLAQSGHTTLIVDANLRRPSQARIWGLEANAGLTDLLLNPQAQPDLKATSVPNLALLGTGQLPANPADVLASKRMGEVLEGLRTLADYILFDVPPVLAVTDAAVLARQLDGVLLVLKAGVTRREQIGQASEQLTRVGANLIGAALINAPQTNYAY